MIDPDLIESDPLAKQALTMLAQTGILRKQQERLLARIKMGDADASDEEILKEIRQCRRESTLLESLHLFGEALSEQGGTS